MASKFPDKFHQPPGKPPMRVRIKDTDFYKNLPPDSGRSFNERLVERYAPSPRVEDRRFEHPDPMLNTNVSVGPFGENKKGTLPDKAQIPPERPNPSDQKQSRPKPRKNFPGKKQLDKASKFHDNLVTPGKWSTKKKI